MQQCSKNAAVTMFPFVCLKWLSINRTRLLMIVKIGELKNTIY